MKEKSTNLRMGILAIATAIVGPFLLACGNSYLISVGDNGGGSEVCKATNDFGGFTNGGDCQYTTFTPEVRSCGISTNETGYNCSQDTNSTVVTTALNDGTCDGYGNCTMGIPNGTNGSITNKMWHLTTCGGGPG